MVSFPAVCTGQSKPWWTVGGCHGRPGAVHGELGRPTGRPPRTKAHSTAAAAERAYTVHQCAIFATTLGENLSHSLTHSPC